MVPEFVTTVLLPKAMAAEALPTEMGPGLVMGLLSATLRAAPLPLPRAIVPEFVIRLLLPTLTAAPSLSPTDTVPRLPSVLLSLSERPVPTAAPVWTVTPSPFTPVPALKPAGELPAQVTDVPTR